MKDKRYIIGNWKMNPETRKEANKLFLEIKGTANKLKNVQTVICAPYVQLPDLVKQVSGHRCLVGAEDVSSEKEGAHTGEVSARQLADLKVSHTIIGHSETRAAGQTDDLVAKKAQLLLKNGITPILCIGEKERDNLGNYTHQIKKQLIASLEGVSKKNIANIIVAYEPIWAIGKNATREATSLDLFEIVILIRKIITDTYGKKAAENMVILYGGSVNAENTASFLSDGQVQGLLVGRASLSAKTFSQILTISNTV